VYNLHYYYFLLILPLFSDLCTPTDLKGARRRIRGVLVGYSFKKVVHSLGYSLPHGILPNLISVIMCKPSELEAQDVHLFIYRSCIRMIDGRQRGVPVCLLIS
jgi:hypothetical protein